MGGHRNGPKIVAAETVCFENRHLLKDLEKQLWVQIEDSAP